MSEKIQISEEQAKEMIDLIAGHYADETKINTMGALKSAGYIKQSALEQAREIRAKTNTGYYNGCDSPLSIIIEIADLYEQAINDLHAEE